MHSRQCEARSRCAPLPVRACRVATRQRKLAIPRGVRDGKPLPANIRSQSNVVALGICRRPDNRVPVRLDKINQYSERRAYCSPRIAPRLISDFSQLVDKHVLVTAAAREGQGGGVGGPRTRAMGRRFGGGHEYEGGRFH